MVENAVATLEYGQVEIFVGTYQNDPDTIHEVDRLANRYETFMEEFSNILQRQSYSLRKNYTDAAARAAASPQG